MRNPFKPQVTKQQIARLNRGQQVPERVAVQHAQNKRGQAAGRRAGGTNLAAQSAAWKKKQAKGKK